MAFVALKPCRFGGTDYKISDSIPKDKVLPERVGALCTMGIITYGVDEVFGQMADSVLAATEAEVKPEVSETSPPKKRGKHKEE